MPNPNLNQTLSIYKSTFENESESLKPLLNQVSLENLGQINLENNIFNRRNFVGHITASGLILSPDKNQILLIKHKILGKFLQPGGHVDFSESPLQAAIRETAEETGLTDLEYIALDKQNPSLPLDIDTHQIPANSKKVEEAHYHHDFRYCFVAKNIDNLKLQISEVSEFRWINIEEIVAVPGLSRVLQKIKSLLVF